MSGTDPSVRDGSRSGRSTLRWSRWNLLLVLPLLILIVPVINRAEPRLFGFPFFYWFQLFWVFVTVACVIVVYRMTRHVGGDR